MESEQKRKKYPSQIKYEDNNPTITFRMKKHEKELIGQMAEQSGKSISMLVRMALLDLHQDFFDATVKAYETGLDHGYDIGYEQGKEEWALWHYCSLCGKAIEIPPDSDAHKAIIEYMRVNGWGHPQCHKKQDE